MVLTQFHVYVYFFLVTAGSLRIGT